MIRFPKHIASILSERGLTYGAVYPLSSIASNQTTMQIRTQNTQKLNLWPRLSLWVGDHEASPQDRASANLAHLVNMTCWVLSTKSRLGKDTKINAPKYEPWPYSDLQYILIVLCALPFTRIVEKLYIGVVEGSSISPFKSKCTIGVRWATKRWYT